MTDQSLLQEFEDPTGDLLAKKQAESLRHGGRKLTNGSNGNIEEMCRFMASMGEAMAMLVLRKAVTPDQCSVMQSHCRVIRKKEHEHLKEDTKTNINKTADGIKAFGVTIGPATARTFVIMVGFAIIILCWRIPADNIKINEIRDLIHAERAIDETLHEVQPD